MAKGELRPLGLVKSGRGKLLFIPGMGAGEWRRLGNAADIIHPLDMGVSPRIWGNNGSKEENT